MPVSSTNKHMGGRGLKAGANKYERFSISIPPTALAAITRYAEAKGLNRSEAITEMITRHDKVWPPRKR